MSSQPKPVFPEIASAAAFEDIAAAKGWPIICDETLQFHSPMLRDLLVLWQKEANSGIPERNVFTARKLQPFIRDIAIFERNGEGLQRRYRVRLMGSGIVQYYGELTGKYFDEVIPEKYLERWYACADLALTTKKAVRLILRADTFEKSHMTAEYLYAPLKAEGGLVKFVLCGIAFDGRRPWSVVEAEERKKHEQP